MIVGCATSAELARTLATVWAERGRVAYARPYNRWRWDESQTWWIVPAPDRLAFRYAKIVVSTAQRLAEPGEIFVGLYVEKGLGDHLPGYYPQEWIIRSTWRWHDVLADLASGTVRPAIAAVAQHLGEPVEIRADAHVPVVNPPSELPHDVVAYETQDGMALSATRPAALRTEQRFLQNVVAVQTVPELANSLQTINGADSAWINLYVGRALRMSSPNDSSALNAGQLADRLLEPLSPWLNSSSA